MLPDGAVEEEKQCVLEADSRPKAIAEWSG